VILDVSQIKIMFKKNIIIPIIISIFCLSVFALPIQAANIFDGIGENMTTFKDKSGLPKAPDPVDVVIKIINLVLSFLALIFTIMILYGGFTYLTASGSPDKAKQALGIIKDSIIGIIIILISGAIVNYVVLKIIEALK